MAIDPNDDLQRAIALIQAGRPNEARPLLEAIVATDPERELAWLWLATVSTDRAERIRFLQRVLTINPTNETARTAYARLTGGPPAPPDRPSAGAEPSPRGVRPGGLLILMAVVAIAVTAVLIAIYVRNEADDTDDATPALTLAAPETLIPTSALSPTPSSTPAPTVTPGPSPTSVWDSAVPTWTAAPTETPAPTQRFATWTPRPPTETPTEIPTERPPTDTDEPEPTASETAPRRPVQTPTGEPTEDENTPATGED